jgi:ribosomal protein L16 Arg81 hydroxylase
MSPVDAEDADLRRFPRYAKAQPIEFVIEPGEILFIPAGWWHHVRALDPSISMNFFWLAPSMMWSMRRHFFYSLRRRMLDRLRLRHLSPEFNAASGRVGPPSR